MTVMFNGVLVQDHVSITKNTPGSEAKSVCDAGPILLQDHFHPEVKDTLLRFRNIWVRENIAPLTGQQLGGATEPPALPEDAR